MVPKSVSDTLISLTIDSSFYAHVLFQLKPEMTGSIPIAAVRLDVPVRLLVNPATFEQLIARHRLGTMKHEVLHIVLEHFLREGNRDHWLFALSCDLAANEFIPPEELIPEAATVPYLSQMLGLSLPRRQSAETYYEYLKQAEVKVEPRGCFPGSGGNGGGSDDLDGTVLVTRGSRQVLTRQLDDHSQAHNSDSASAELIREYVRQLVDQAVKACGNVPLGLEEYIQALQRHRVNWRRVLARFLAGRGRMLRQPTYLREHRRYPEYPGYMRRVGMEALIAIDTSGSMDNRELADIIAQLLQIKKISGTKLWVVWGDTQREGGPIPLEKIGSQVKIKGRGGTDLCWPFKIADQMRVPAVVYFTDGYGPAPESVRQRVLWVITSNGCRPAPYGDVVLIEQAGKAGSVAYGWS